VSDSHQTSPGRITSIQAVAVRIVCENPEPAHPSSAVDPQNSSLKLTGAPLVETRSHPVIVVSEGQGSKSIGTDQIEFPMRGASAAWIGEVRAPNQDDALSSPVPRDGGGLRIGLLTAMLIGALGLGWWTGLWEPSRFLKSDPVSTPLQQIALPDRAPPALDQQTPSGAPDNQVSSPAGSDLGSSSKRLGSEPTPRTDQGVVSAADTVPTTAQKTPGTKPAAVPRVREKKALNRPTPTPDTRPTTIEGWTVRNVSGRTAVLQGPDGIRRVSVGDTVPGAGRIDSIVRWGNRWIVATSKGLITTD
jgi:hypothetical protein